MDIGSRIKGLRVQRGLTQEQLANALFVSRQTILNWEQGRTAPDAQSLLMLSALFGVTVDALMKGDVQAMQAIIASQRKRLGAMLSLGGAMGLAGSAVIAAPLVGALGPAGGALALVPAATALAATALAARRTNVAAPLTMLRDRLAQPTSLTLTCSGRQRDLEASVDGGHEAQPFRITQTGSVPRGRNWSIVDASGERAGTVALRLIAAGVPCPYISARIEGVGSVKMEKVLSLATGYRNIWKLSGGDVAIDGDWLGGDVSFLRGDSPLARVRTAEGPDDAPGSDRVYRIEAATSLLTGPAVVLTFMLALMRDIERPMV